jgi:signal transduction histidine kinase
MRERARWPSSGRRGLQGRIVLVVAVAMVAPTALFAWIAWSGVGSVSRHLDAERGVLARSVGDHLEYVVNADLQALQSIGAALRATPPDDETTERSAVRDAYLRSRVLEAVLLLSDPVQVVWEEPARARQHVSGVIGLPLAREAFATGTPAVSDLILEPGGGRRLYFLVPLRDLQGRVTRVAAGVVDPASERFVSLLDPFRAGVRGTTEVVDRAGAVVATTTSRRRDATERPAGDDPVVASVALGVVPWRVLIREPDDGTLGPRGAHLALVGAGVIALGLLFAWGAASSIRRPLSVLTTAAEHIAGGNLHEPIPPLGDDEVGRLGRALDHMRAALGESHASLERRVEERTHELERLYRELSLRDAARAELLRKVISAQEEERRRIARELHDETSQSLAALTMSLDAAAAELPPGTPRKRLEDARGIAGRAITEVHRLLFDLRPSVLDDLGLASAIRWCTERTLEPLGIAVRCEFSGLESRLPPELETTLFRVVQEAVNNIARHAGADTVLIQCAVRDAVATVEIEDDGRGFDPARPAPTEGTGLGLAGMRERVTLLGGTLAVESAPGEGTRLCASVPIPVAVARA